ncbi:DUF1217 domain-containing protein [Ferrovibrio sp.]|uniref:DUF1217 domain-containing protein n=1 Tax=Ferrovibrio sp. TaxID=1917215 RepID=UPI00261B7C59|nr:DUF1217 domain-containing protein [Ferrovibrio sp.]
MSIDLSILYGGAGTGAATMSPMAMYRKLQKLAAENEDKSAPDADAEKAKAVTREFNNAAIRLRNAQAKENNARVQNDALYYKNRAATATTVSELINDDRFMRVLAYGNGYEDLFKTNPQKLRDILTSDLNDPNSVARKGTLKDIELAKKYNFAATGTLVDVDGNPIGLDSNGRVVNGATLVTPLEPGLAKIRNLLIDMNGKALVTANSKDPADDGKLLFGSSLVAKDASIYSGKQSKTLMPEQAAPTNTKSVNYYEFDSPDFQRFRERRDIKAEIDYFTENASQIKSVDDFFSNSRLMKFVLSAYDLESEAQYPGKIRKILESDLTDPDSLANRFQDPRFKQMTEDLGIFLFKESRLKMGSTAIELGKKFEQVKYEKYLDEQAPGVRAAIEFTRRIKNVDLTVQMLGDSVLREVITVANNIPKELAYQEVESQITALEKRVDVKSLKGDQNEIEKVVTRYLTFKDAGTSSPQSYLLNLFG